MMRFLAWLLPIAFLLFTGCGMDSEKGILMAAGAYGDLAVVMSDDALRPLAGRFMSEMNLEKTFVIKPETLFKPDYFGPGKWEFAKGYKNALFLVRIGDGGSAEKGARKLMSGDAWDRLTAGGGGIVKVIDPWSTYQQVVVVASRDRNNLGSILNKNAEKIRNIFEDSNRDRILRRNRYDGLNTAQMDVYWNRFGIFLEIPGEYLQNQFEPDGYPGLELMRNGPSRGISLAWSKSDDPAALLGDREAMAEFRILMGEKLHGEEIIPSSFVWSDAVIQGVTCAKLEGAWTSNKFSGGGAFWCYFIPDAERGRIFCLDLLVYAPGMDKMNFFRRMDAVARTFSTRRPQP
ncbi:MAG: DUF4837 family protein [Candidatus Krumholzibacteria bacterium]|nr:DUF4837 family protein [Candidatus Krumholzibacteria bacterium]